MQIQRRRIDGLTPHPQQGLIYNDLSDREFQSLKDDIAKHGLRQPVEITAAGMLMDGCHRVRALKELGFDEVDVIICDEMTDDAVEERFVNANLLRRQLDAVSKARAIKRLAEIESRKSGIRIDLHTDHSFRDRLARLLGDISGRTVDRYLQLLRLDRVIQDAVASGQLPMSKALKIESLPIAKRQSIVERISRKEPAGKVVTEYLRRTQVVEKDTPEDLYHSLLRFFDESLEELVLHAEVIAGTVETNVPATQLMSRAAEFCDQMRGLELQAQDEAAADSRKLADVPC